MFRIGLDVHWKTTSVCILNENGQVIKEKGIKGYLNKTIEVTAVPQVMGIRLLKAF